ncbi:MAG TPA: hypothetical protein VE402_00760, partial [Candidatus Angelobacter sp.]|nr:hypothetical protein [Candidatus Angelobacter sp.]
MAKRQLELIARERTERITKRKRAPKAGPKALPKAAGKPSPKPIVRLTATDLATRQREISVSEFFTKNR